MPACSYSCCRHPAPSPSSNRPPLSRSSVASILGQQHRVAKVVGEDKGAEAQARGGLGGHGEREERCNRLIEVVGQQEGAVPEGLDAVGRVRDDLSGPAAVDHTPKR